MQILQWNRPSLHQEMAIVFPLLLTMAHGIAVVALDASSLMCTLESYPPVDYQ